MASKETNSRMHVLSRLTAALLVLSFLSDASGQVHGPIRPVGTLENPHYPRALADGLHSPKVVTAISEHLRGTIEWASGESTSLSGGADGDFDDLIVRFDSAHWCPDPVSRSTWGAVKSRFR